MEQFTPETNNYLSSITDQFISEDASTGQRFVNYLIDTVVMYVFTWGSSTILLLFFYATSQGQQPRLEGLQLILFPFVLLLFVVFFTFSEGVSSGRSIGKLVTGTKVVKTDESEITWKDAFVRSLCRLVPFEPFSALGGYPWHDRWTNTKVIKLRK